MTLRLIAVLSLLLMMGGGGPELWLRWTPRLPMAPISGRVTVTFVAEVKGEITEAWYCPGVAWRIDSDAQSIASYGESDCDPWAERVNPPERMWTLQQPLGKGFYAVTVTLRKSGKTLARQTAEFEVR